MAYYMQSEQMAPTWRAQSVVVTSIIHARSGLLSRWATVARFTTDSSQVFSSNKEHGP